MRKIKGLILCFLFSVMFITALQASGTGAGVTITAPSTDLKIVYGDGSGGSTTKNASIDGINDWASEVKAVHGLLPGEISCPTIVGFTGANHGPYIGITGNQEYAISFTYNNRSNESITADIAAAVLGGGGRWTVADTSELNVDEDQNKTFFVTINVGNALAFERITVNITASITAVPSTTKNVVSYNAFENAVGDMQNGAYGGIDDIFNYYVLEAQGFNLSVVSRSVEVIAPTSRGYNGGANDPVPGAKIKYSIAVRNDGSTVATNVDISDKIPNNCHLYFNDTPEVLGERNNHWVAEPDGFAPTLNTTAAGTVITFNDVNISPNNTVTLSYTVTID